MFTTMKKIYMIPVLRTTTFGVENMIAVSGPQTTTETPADQDAGMDVKESLSSGYNVWNDDWSN